MLVLHITLAIFSLVFVSLGKKWSSLAAVFATSISGIYLGVSTGQPIFETCKNISVYLVVLSGIYFSQRFFKKLSLNNS